MQVHTQGPNSLWSRFFAESKAPNIFKSAKMADFYFFFFTVKAILFSKLWGLLKIDPQFPSDLSYI